MLPGLRFLLLATTMSVSVLVFALGAAALLRATHENFATLPQRRPPQEQVFVKQHFDTSQPVIALLRAEPEPTKADGAAVPAFASPPPDAQPAATESKTDTQPVRELQAAGATTDAQPSLPRAVGLPDIPELPMPLMPDVSFLQSEFLRTAEKKDVAIAAASAIETTPVAAPLQQPAIPDAAKSGTTPAQKLAALSDGGAETEKLAVEAKKKAEASAVRIRNQQAAKRARAARVAAQRRAAAIRARAAQQQQQTQPFGLPLGTN